MSGLYKNNPIEFCSSTDFRESLGSFLEQYLAQKELMKCTELLFNGVNKTNFVCCSDGPS